MDNTTSYSISEAAELLNLSSKTIRRYIKSGKLPSIKVPTKFGDEYRVTEIPEALKQEAAAQAAEQARVGIVPAEEEEKKLDVQLLYQENIRMAAQLGAATERIRQLEEQIKSLEATIKESQDKNLRLYAEFDNYRKRVVAEKEDFAKYAATDLVKKFLPIMDSFERAKISFEKHTEEKEELKKGLALIYKQFEDTLTGLGVKKIETVGKHFDPQFHEAIMQQEQNGVVSGTILEEVQPGFLLYDRLLRPAMVIVAK